jgi:hypothetical protein
MEYLNDTIEKLLNRFTPVLAEDYEKYRNHVYRVFLNCRLIDNERSNEEKYATAAVFHDIGIWTHDTVDYLEPSIEEARKYLIEAGRPDWIEEISLMIYWHHKTKTYKGNYGNTVECFRKADWIDVSLGLLTYGFDAKTLKLNRKILPNKGFHWFLIKRIGKNFLRHPLKPLPMFKT